MTDSILATATPAQLGAAVYLNLYDLFRAMAQLPGAELEELPGLSRHHAFPGNPMFKGVWQTRLRPDDLESAITDSLNYFRVRNAPFIFWWLDPESAPSDTGDRLQAHGFVPFEQNAPGFAAELSALNYDLMQRVPSGFVIERVSNEQQLLDFKQAFVNGLEVPEWAGQAWVEAAQTMGIGRTPWVMYMGYLDGQPVASNMLFTGAGVASVFGVATVPAARRKGLGAAITLIAYQDALRMGYKYGVLFASDLGAPVYKRIGMTDCGIGLSRYLWRNDTASASAAFHIGGHEG